MLRSRYSSIAQYVRFHFKTGDGASVVSICDLTGTKITVRAPIEHYLTAFGDLNLCHWGAVATLLLDARAVLAQDTYERETKAAMAGKAVKESKTADKYVSEDDLNAVIARIAHDIGVDAAWFEEQGLGVTMAMMAPFVKSEQLVGLGYPLDQMWQNTPATLARFQNDSNAETRRIMALYGEKLVKIKSAGAYNFATQHRKSVKAEKAAEAAEAGGAAVGAAAAAEPEMIVMPPRAVIERALMVPVNIYAPDQTGAVKDAAFAGGLIAYLRQHLGEGNVIWDARIGRDGKHLYVGLDVSPVKNVNAALLQASGYGDWKGTVYEFPVKAPGHRAQIPSVAKIERKVRAKTDVVAPLPQSAPALPKKTAASKKAKAAEATSADLATPMEGVTIEKRKRAASKKPEAEAAVAVKKARSPKAAAGAAPAPVAGELLIKKVKRAKKVAAVGL